MNVPRLVAAVVASTLLIFGPSGCEFNAGTAAKNKLQTFLDTIGEVTLVQLSEDNTLPFTGWAGGHIVISADTPSERAQEILNLVGAYRADPANNVEQLAFEWGDLLLGVAESRDRNNAYFDEGSDLLSKPGVSAVVLSSPDNFFRGRDDIAEINQNSGVVLVAETSGDFLSVFELAVDHSAAARDPFRDPGAAAQTADGLFYATSTVDFDTALNPSSAIAIYEAVEQLTPVLEAKLSLDSIELRVGTAEDRAAAEQLVSTMLVPSDFTTVINNGLLTTSEDAAPDAEALFKATDGMPGVEAVLITGDSVTVTLESIESVAEFRSAIGEPSHYPGIGSISLKVLNVEGSTVTPPWSLTASPSRLDEFLALSAALWATGEVKGMTLALAQSSITLESSDLDTLGQIFSATNGRWPDGLKTQLRTMSKGERGFFEVRGNTLISAQPGTTDAEQQFIARVLKAWNAA